MFKLGNAAAFRRSVAGVSLLLAPVLFAGAEILAPDSNGTGAAQLANYAQHRAVLLAAALLGLGATMFFVPAIFGILHKVRERGVTFAHIAAAMCIYGLVTAHAALGGVNIMFYEMTSPNLNKSAMASLLDTLSNGPAIAAPLLLGHFVLAIGMLLLGIGVWRSRAFPRWAGPCIVLWIVVDILIGSAPVNHVVADIASNAFALIGFGTLGWTLLTSTNASWDHLSAEPIAHTPENASAQT
jgi:hypothetical protein